MARLSQLAGNQRVILTPTVTIAFLLALFQQGFSLFNLTTQFFYLSPQMRKRKANAVCNTCSLQTKLELLLN